MTLRYHRSTIVPRLLAEAVRGEPLSVGVPLVLHLGRFLATSEGWRAARTVRTLPRTTCIPPGSDSFSIPGVSVADTKPGPIIGMRSDSQYNGFLPDFLASALPPLTRYRGALLSSGVMALRLSPLAQHLPPSRRLDRRWNVMARYKARSSGLVGSSGVFPSFRRGFGRTRTPPHTSL